MSILVPPLKCQGIKTKLVPWVKELAGKNFDRWIEPFLGSGVVAFNSEAKKAYLADINPHIIVFYKAMQKNEINPVTVRNYLEKEGEFLSKADEKGYVHFRFIRDRFNKEKASLDFLFLSRAGFNGMMRFSKTGNRNIPFCKKPNRFSQSYITKIANQVKYCSEAIQKDWVFKTQDFRETILNAKEGDLIYCDPPYAGRYVDYFSGWTDKDEHDLFELLSKSEAKFILSSWHHNDFRKNEMIDRYWNKFNIVTRDHFYHSGAKEKNRNAIVEALVFNFNSDIQKHNHGLENTTNLQINLFDKEELLLATA
jgi:DNA adenine methylase